MDSETKNNQSNSVQSWWKWAFIGLLILNIGGMIWFGSQLQPVNTAQKQVASQDPSSSQSDELIYVKARASLEDVQKLIASYLEDEIDDEELSLNIAVDDQLTISGVIQWLLFDFPFEMSFDIFAMENGDIQLRTVSSNLGRINMPIELIFNHLANSLPETSIISLDSENEVIFIHLTQSDLIENGMIKAERIDTDEGFIEFGLYYQPDIVN